MQHFIRFLITLTLVTRVSASPDVTPDDEALVRRIDRAGKPMLADEDVEVRLATIASLEDLHNRRTRAALHGALNAHVPELSFAAAKPFFELNDPVGQQVLLSVL